MLTFKLALDLWIKACQLFTKNGKARKASCALSWKNMVGEHSMLLEGRVHVGCVGKGGWRSRSLSGHWNLVGQVRNQVSLEAEFRATGDAHSLYIVALSGVSWFFYVPGWRTGMRKREVAASITGSPRERFWPLEMSIATKTVTLSSLIALIVLGFFSLLKHST